MIMPGQFNARSPDPGMMMEGSFPAKLMRINKQPQANPALIGTPTAPGKYYSSLKKLSTSNMPNLMIR